MTLSIVGFSQVHKTKIIANQQIGRMYMQLKESVTNEDFKIVSRRILLTFKTESCDCPGVNVIAGNCAGVVDLVEGQAQAVRISDTAITTIKIIRVIRISYLLAQIVVP